MQIKVFAHYLLTASSKHRQIIHFEKEYHTPHIQ